MSKKSKRRTSRNNGTGRAVVARRTEAEFAPDYTDVKKDLVRIGSLAGGFLAILIVLSFILN